MQVKEYEQLSKLIEETKGWIADDARNYIHFLRCACNNYKYTLNEQLLIYVQNPIATACAEQNVWQSLGRSINSSDNAISLIESDNKVRQVYDVADTNGKNRVYLWQINANDDIIKSSLQTDGRNIREVLHRAIDQEIHLPLENSELFVQSARAAVGFSVLLRCGYNIDEYYDDFDFDFEMLPIHQKYEMFKIVSETSDVLLRKIETLAKRLHREKNAQRSVENINNQERTNNYERTSKNLKRITRKLDGGTGREVDTTATRTVRTSDTSFVEDVRHGETARVETVETTFLVPNSRADGVREQGNRNGNENGGERGLQRSAESTRPDEMDGTDEQLSSMRKGSSDGRTSIATDKAESEKLSAFVFTKKELNDIFQYGSGFTDGKYRIYQYMQENHTKSEFAEMLKKEYGIGGCTFNDGWLNYNGKGIEYKVESNSVHFTWEQAAKEIIRLNDDRQYLSPTEYENYPKYLKKQAEKKHLSSISQEFLDLIRQYNSEASDKLNLYVLSLCATELMQKSMITHCRVKEGEKILPLMRSTLEQIADSDSTLSPKATILLNRINTDGMITALEQKAEVTSDTPQVNMDYVYNVGSKVFIGSTEYVITAISDNSIELYDDNMPLFMKNFTSAEFREKLTENPMNDRLLQVVSNYNIEAENDDKAVEDVSVNLSEEQVEAEVTSAQQSTDDLLGQTIHIDDRDFVIESISTNGSVSMRDNTFQQAKGFPIFRVEPIEFVRSIVKQQSEQKVEPIISISSPEKGEKINYTINDSNIGVGTPSERYQNNISAITLLKQIETDKRYATVDEQQTLAKYVGWGGLADYFDEHSGKDTDTLKNILTESEYSSARASTLSAFYTPPVVIEAMYKVLDNMGFSRGNILEPSCGVGNFIGMLPEKMSQSKIYGVEIDSISSRIASKLYPNAQIINDGYEKTNLSDNFFDIAIGNVPFGDIKILDKRYDKHNFLIHDYFFAKTIDKVRSGGVIAFITSQGTMDKKSNRVRKYIAQRAELLGAIRLPNNTFKSAAGTEVTSDILFLQKRDRIVDIEPDWVRIGQDEHGYPINQYFVDNPQMILGEMKEVSSRFGTDIVCVATENSDLSRDLTVAIQNIHAQYEEYIPDEIEVDGEVVTIPADPNVRNFSYTTVDGDIYYRENSIMIKEQVNATAEKRIKGMVGIRDSIRKLIEYQTLEYEDGYIKGEQENLNKLYDDYVGKYGRIADKANKNAFIKDNSYSLLSALELYDNDNKFVGKAKIFTSRTIKPYREITSVDTAQEALAVSLSTKAKVDLPYMAKLLGKDIPIVVKQLQGVIFKTPESGAFDFDTDGENWNNGWQTADEYLSGNVRQKLKLAQMVAETDSFFDSNVEGLQQVQPKDLTATEISVRLGTTWIPSTDIDDFMHETFETPFYARHSILTSFSEYTGTWNISNKSSDTNVSAQKYGTKRMSAYKILEESLNLKEVRVFDYVEDSAGKRTAVLNEKETQFAQSKQEMIKNAFNNWVWKNPNRRERLCKIYNEKFNSTRPREYDGSHLEFVGINPEVTLRPHQVNAIAHILYGGNTLLAHVVGAGKTFEMVAAAQESKRLGLCNKSLFVVPNHLTEQMATEYLQLYPAANILVARKKDFEKKNRRRFTAQIATGDYDAIIIGHSQFEKIPLSIERQQQFLQEQLDEILQGIEELKYQRGSRFSVKELERERKSVSQKLEKLNDQSRKDDVITFEELGVDRIFIDEAHYFKNLAVFTKMRNVGGIAQTEAQKSSDLYMKCRYLDEITGGRGIVFATGTPVSNSMVEMYTMQKYLQYNTLKQHHLENFDCWASTFGETTTEIALAPDGKSFQSKTRFSKFYNLPELMAMFKEVADIKTADMLNLDVPTAIRHNEITKPSNEQKEMVNGLSERADKVHKRLVAPDVDNMLNIVNDGRKLALDQRMMDDMLPKSETSKVVRCADNVYRIWSENAETKATQLVFCDLSTPKSTGFNVYNALKDELTERGMPSEEIAFIHSAKTEEQKKQMFKKVRNGQIRVLVGSTPKMGAGTNVQERLIALHHLDCPWRPSDLEQREGRIVRQGNRNKEVEIYSYVTEGTFDAYSYQTVENKQKFIGQIFTSKSPARCAEDIDEVAFNYAIIKSQCTGDPRIKEKLELDTEVTKLKLLKANFLNEKYELEDKVRRDIPLQITATEQRIENFKSDITLRDNSTYKNEDNFSPMILLGKQYDEKKSAGKALLTVVQSVVKSDTSIGNYRGFDLTIEFDGVTAEHHLILNGAMRHRVILGKDELGNITRTDNVLDNFENKLNHQIELKENLQHQIEEATAQIETPFPQEQELEDKQKRLQELNIALNVGGVGKKEDVAGELFAEAKAEREAEQINSCECDM